MAFSKQQLELLEDILDEQLRKENKGLSTIASHTDLRELIGTIHSELWAIARTIPRKDKAAIEAARKAGITQIVGRNTEPAVEAKSRLKPEVVKAKDGDTLLAMLGL